MPHYLEKNHHNSQLRTQNSEIDSCGVCPPASKHNNSFIRIFIFLTLLSQKNRARLLSVLIILLNGENSLNNYPYGNVYDWLQFIGAENKQGNITANECNDIIRKLSLKSFESEYKILIMWMPEYLGNEGNKLLKLIEEPPPNTLFILVAENESLILPTIVSRCQLIKIPTLETTDIEAALIEDNKMQILQKQDRWLLQLKAIIVKHFNCCNMQKKIGKVFSRLAERDY